jgi:tetraacyldisaccharide 4'-kinase
VVLLMPADLAQPDPDLVALFKGKPVFIARLEPAGPAPTHPVLAFAGIGKPWKFERSLIAAGAVLKDFAPFPDHGEYREADLAFLEQRAAQLGGTLLTTEKDWVRLPGAWRRKVDYWPVRARFEDEAAVQALLRSAL